LERQKHHSPTTEHTALNALGKRQPQRPRYRCEDSINVDLKEITSVCVDSTGLFRGSVQRPSFVNRMQCSGSIEISELRNEMSNCKLLKKDSAARVSELTGSTHKHTVQCQYCCNTVTVLHKHTVQCQYCCNTVTVLHKHTVQCQYCCNTTVLHKHTVQCQYCSNTTVLHKHTVQCQYCCNTTVLHKHTRDRKSAYIVYFVANVCAYFVFNLVFEINMTNKNMTSHSVSLLYILLVGCSCP
jgi:hypothetical protein